MHLRLRISFQNIKLVLDLRDCSRILLTISDRIAEGVSGTHFSELLCPKFVSTISRQLSAQVRRLTRSSNLPKWAPSQSWYEPPWTKLASSTTRYRHTVLLKQLPCGGTFCSCAHVRQMRITLSRSHSWRTIGWKLLEAMADTNHRKRKMRAATTSWFWIHE